MGASALYGGSWLEGAGAVFAENKAVIDSDIKNAKERAAKEGKTIALPKGGFGTGLAALATKAPLTFAYLNKRLQEEFGFNNTTGELAAQGKPTADARTDIERRRQEELTTFDPMQDKTFAKLIAKETSLRSSYALTPAESLKNQLEAAEKATIQRGKELGAEINAKYDAEIAALEGGKEEPTKTYDNKPIAKSLQGKVIYITPDAYTVGKMSTHSEDLILGSDLIQEAILELDINAVKARLETLAQDKGKIGSSAKAELQLVAVKSAILKFGLELVEIMLDKLTDRLPTIFIV